ncbi:MULTISPECIES: sulfatase [unclassified Streptomyces]|uniref:sulfatase n=1 Tax=unclassified Streptomyces TaxID=2593676 RepID=UPI0016617AA9|nr:MULTISPECIES: sulfatase [unclassified Streptomyces]MBD0712332.1 sulfatase [Streptomyces sp. CBMA291]MBD0716706.1 sulfatase [Streptomyces sp. CBMA370]
MKAIMVMFDSLNRHMLPPYGADWTHAPNFARLAERAVTFDNAYAGSMPCMPARRELHTGRYNFLHRSWGPLEPFDDSTPELLKQNGVYTHLSSDHPHYWEDGGATYHGRYNTWEFSRGQEGDPWKGHVADPETPESLRRMRHESYRQDWINRQYMATEDRHPQTLTFDAGLDFIRTNKDSDRWFLQIETFDPHEPFFTHQRYKDLYPHDYEGPHFDWPDYTRVTETDDQVAHARFEYAALLSMCDRSLGRVLDAMDEHGLWDDTLLIVNTDHGFLLGEKGWWAKAVQPWFNELVHLPLFVWDPRHPGTAGERRASLVQTIDIAPTLLDHFGVARPADMQGSPLPVADDTPVREAGLFGAHGGHVNVTDGRYVYMRAPLTTDNSPLYEHTLMPTHMRGRFSPAELAHAELAGPFGFTKGIQTLRTPARPLLNPYHQGTLLFDLENDPHQLSPLVDDAAELRMATLLVDTLRASEAPPSQYARLGLPETGPVTEEHLLVRAQRERAESFAEPLPRPEDYPTGRLSLRTPVRTLIADPVAGEILRKHLPALLATELLQFLAGMSLIDVAGISGGQVPATALRSIADELATV